MRWSRWQEAGVALLVAAGLCRGAGASAGADRRTVASRPVAQGDLRLVADSAGVGRLVYVPRSGPPQPIDCEPLVGAWGLWVGDVDRDGRPEAIVALRKPARFDPRLENRLHVYHLIDGQCVPAWRGPRLVGRFDRVAVEGDRIVVLERMGHSWQRIARYRWAGFGYQVEEELWRGRRPPDRAWLARFEREAPR
jgi:hypothetical protein